MIPSPYLTEQLFNALKEPIFVYSSSTKEVQFANASFLQFMGIAPGEMKRLSVLHFWPEAILNSTTPQEIATEFSGQKGELIATTLSLTPLKDNAYLVRIISGLSKRESQIRLHAQRLETLGMLAGGVAHDFNNILAGMLGHVSYLKAILPGSGPHLESLQAIEDGGMRASVMTQQILNFSRNDSTQKAQRVNLAEFISKSCVLLRGAISPRYQLEQQHMPGEVYVLAPEGGLAQVLVNLVINARDALAKDGKILVRTERETDVVKLREIFKIQDLSAKQFIRMSVIDNGHGMSAEVMQRCFEPFFSTKQDKGTGLGLATVQSIVKALGGAIEISSEVGVGTTISILLPEIISQETPKEKHARGDAPRIEGGDERVLVVDDEFPVRNVLCVSLEHLGYTVESAGSGIEAIEKFTLAAGNYDLVILDMLMPNLSGDQVFFRLKETSPSVRVLLISGYSSEGAVKHVLENGGIDFIQKPFTIEELAKKVRSCLEK